jgi:hypothetical protein
LQAEYPLHPYRRRGGKEAVLGSSPHLSESVSAINNTHDQTHLNLRSRTLCSYWYVNPPSRQLVNS